MILFLIAFLTYESSSMKRNFWIYKKKKHPDLLTLTVREIEGKQTTLNQS